MRRGYQADEVEEGIRKLRNIRPGIRLSTHVLVGFPGEKEGDFRETIELLARRKFDHIIAHRYTDRPKTLASAMPWKVAESEKIRRLWRLRRKFPETCRIRV
jgi:tRNA A37 methylthiotransferase MiaB